jgi:hypothetical protein
MVIFVLATFIVGSLAGMGLVEMLYNDGWIFAFRVLGAIEAAVLPIALYIWREKLREYLYWQFGITIFILVGLCCMGVLLGAPYVFLVNAATAHGETIRFEGPVLAKRVSNGKSTTYIVEIEDRRTGRQVELTTKREEYESIKVGATVSRCMQLGGLEIPFRWRYFGSPPVCMAT